MRTEALVFIIIKKKIKIKNATKFISTHRLSSSVKKNTYFVTEALTTARETTPPNSGGRRSRPPEAPRGLGARKAIGAETRVNKKK